MARQTSRNVYIPLAAASLVLVSSAAYAAALTKTGEIKSIDTAKQQFQLQSGDTFAAGKSVKLQNLKAGEKVSIVYESKDGKMVASKVHAVK